MSLYCMIRGEVVEEGRRAGRAELPKEKIGMAAGELEGVMYILYQGGKKMKPS